MRILSVSPSRAGPDRVAAVWRPPAAAEQAGVISVGEREALASGHPRDEAPAAVN